MACVASSVFAARPLNAVRGAAASKPRASAKTFAVKAERPLWYPGAKAPAHLDGTMAGDYGTFVSRTHRFHSLPAGSFFARKDGSLIPPGFSSNYMYLKSQLVFYRILGMKTLCVCILTARSVPECLLTLSMRTQSRAWDQSSRR